VKQSSRLQEAVKYLVRDFNNPVTARLFFRLLLVLTFFRIVITWSFSHNVMDHHAITLPASWLGRIVFAPSFLANQNVDIFFGFALVVIAGGFIFPLHYIARVLFFWLTFNLYIVYLPFANGSDIVLFMLAVWCIPIASKPLFKSETIGTIQKACYNSAFILAQLQVVFFYLVSGWDKLKSETWRSGVAFDYVAHLGNMYNPMFVDVFDTPVLQLILSWIVILFELSFVVLVWFEKTRIPILILGLFFHLFIWIVMTLPDFASVMMVSYILFLKDDDYQRLPDRFKRLLL
jgi:hypothetical protein